MKNSKSIKPPALQHDDRPLLFSFKYFQSDHPKFRLSAYDAGFMAALLLEIQRYSQLTVGHFCAISGEDHRHPIYFPQTSEGDGFPGIEPAEDSHLWTDSPWQFALFKGAHPRQCGWRVHGFIADDTFYIVWLDPLHLLD